jgi:hypothetical protein
VAVGPPPRSGVYSRSGLCEAQLRLVPSGAGTCVDVRISPRPSTLVGICGYAIIIAGSAAVLIMDWLTGYDAGRNLRIGSAMLAVFTWLPFLRIVHQTIGELRERPLEQLVVRELELHRR